MKVRKRHDKDTWHWCSNCSNWPTAPDTYEERDVNTIPASGEQCNECRSKTSSGTCARKY